ncbi:MAG: hypothetical protein ACD_66C00151G0005 [uncultured bacterium]|nr:MAG: hypothetical protein ACD_66C00151G0005 [uncultured bacterium]HAN06800.1 hypothetical protein [Candidatus Uhrbacteria bacterium]HBA51396.1 hypothetical protein [Candidatus Uhrbacteria bacterium]HBC39695.1 hypothetical protein [Candidatus Uhrbacteria bacterium]
MMLFMGIVLTVVPSALILGFALAIFFSFVRDDPTAKGIVNFALIILGMGLVLIATHVVGTYFI